MTFLLTPDNKREGNWNSSYTVGITTFAVCSSTARRGWSRVDWRWSHWKITSGFLEFFYIRFQSKLKWCVSLMLLYLLNYVWLRIAPRIRRSVSIHLTQHFIVKHSSTASPEHAPFFYLVNKKVRVFLFMTFKNWEYSWEYFIETNIILSYSL